MSCIVELQKAIDYIEKNIEEEINYETISKEIGMSPYYFHRMFSNIVGVSPAEYIRNRRLSLAADELSSSKASILDTAIKYQYGSNESFTRAFTKFHNVTPKMAKVNGTKLKNYSPIRLSLDIAGGNIINYKMVEKDEFKICAMIRDFSIETKDEIPKFWNEIKENGKIEEINEGYTRNVVGVCIGEANSKCYKYGIGRIIESQDKGFEGSEIIKVEKSKWVIFKCNGQKADDINNLWSKIYKEYFSTSEYKQSMDIDLEFYDDKDTEIWIPINK